MSESAVLATSASASVTPQKKRLVYLDSIRGFLLVLMAVNHVPGALHGFTEHPFGYVSAAEGFVFLAGLMAGLIYTRKLLREGEAAFRQACQARARAIYLHHVFTYGVIFLIMVGYAAATGHLLPDTPPQMVMHPLAASVTGPLLLYQPALLDVLPMYCGFMLLVPVLVRAFERSRRAEVLAVSFAGWALTNAFCPQAPLTTAYFSAGAFNVCAWQLLFVVGAACGHAWVRQARLLPEISAAGTVLLLGLAALLFAVRHTLLSPGFAPETLDWLTNKNNFAPLRMLNAAVLFLLLRQLVARAPQALSWRPLAFLGRASISVFTAHVLMAYGIQAFPRFFADTAVGQWASPVLMLGVLTAAAQVHASLRKSSIERRGLAALDSKLASQS